MAHSIFWAGDSTVKSNDFTTYPQTGIGQVLGLFLKKEVIIQNHAENGRSTKSFIDESRLARIYNEIREDDFLFIQFGHNDSKSEDPLRYCEANGEYQENLERFINVARNRKAYPVLITPLCRRLFKDNHRLEDNIHGEYPEAMIFLGRKLNVPVIDLYQLSRELIETLGLYESKKLFMNLSPSEFSSYPDGLTDNTHLKYDGAFSFAYLIAKKLKDLGEPYQQLLNNSEQLYR